MIKRLIGWDGSPFWRERQGQQEYRRLAGGLSWPWGDLPGWLVLLGEERHKRPEDGRRHINVLHAWQGKGKQGDVLAPREIMDEARALSVRSSSHVWASPGDLPDAALLPMYNRELERREARLVLRTPPNYERQKAFLIYDRLLERRTGTEKSLHIGQGGDKQVLQNECAIIHAADRVRPLEEFPSIAALLYSLAWLDMTSCTGSQRQAAYIAPSVAGY